MTSLLVQSCSATKERVESPVPALDLYDGYFFKIIKKAMRTNTFRPELDILIISAEHGVIDPEDKISYYDRRMNFDRASELNDEIVSTLSNNITENSHHKVWINLGKDYSPAIDGLEAAVETPVHYIEGSGIGNKGKQLKNLVTTGRSMSAYSH